MDEILSIEELNIQLELCGKDLNLFQNRFPHVFTNNNKVKCIATNKIVQVPVIDIKGLGKFILDENLDIISQEELNDKYYFIEYDISGLQVNTFNYLPERVGNLYASSNWFTSLVGMPKVNHSITLYNNRLTDLVGLPKDIIKGNLKVGMNNLETLTGSPLVVKGSFVCDHNNLQTLEGGPVVVEGNYLATNNPLKSLKGAPRVIKGIDKQVRYGMFVTMGVTSRIMTHQLYDYLAFLSCPSESLMDERGCYQPKEED